MRALPRQHRAPPRRRAGLTLIEVMIVVVIAAIAATAASLGLDAITAANLGRGSMRITAGARYAYGRAIAQGTTVRLVLDLDSNQMSFEEAHGRVTLARLDDATRQDLEEGEDQAAVDPWAAARARLEDTLHPSFGASPFSAIPGRRYRAQDLADGIRIERLIVPHEPEPRETGIGAVYFFPGGQTEHAVIHIADSQDRVHAIELHPLTGRTRVYDHAYEPRQLMDDGRGGQTSEIDD